jgi:hypothetical protein
MPIVRRAVLACFPILFLLCVSHPARAQFGEASHRKIEGTVYYAADGTPADHIIIEVISSEGLNVDHFTTDERGRFNFFGLSPGIYQLAINLQDFEPVTAEADVTMASAEGVVVNLVKRSGVGSANSSSHPAGGSLVSAHMMSMPQKAQDAFTKGQHNLYQAKDPSAGLKDFQEAVKDAPTFYEAYEQMGMAYLMLKQPDDAEKAVRKSIDLSKDKFASAEVDLSSLLMDKKQFAEGEKPARRSIELDPNSWRGYYELSRALFNQDRVSEALASAEKSRDLNPLDPTIYRLLAIIHIKQKDKTSLIVDLDQYIKLDPDSPAGVRAKQIRAQLGPAPAPAPAAVKDAPTLGHPSTPSPQPFSN